MTCLIEWLCFTRGKKKKGRMSRVTHLPNRIAKCMVWKEKDDIQPFSRAWRRLSAFDPFRNGLALIGKPVGKNDRIAHHAAGDRTAKGVRNIV